MQFPDILTVTGSGTTSYDERAAMLYALALGFGADPLDERELTFVCEPALTVVPTMNVLLATGAGAIIEQSLLDYRRIVHGEQRLSIHRPLPARASIRSRSRCIGVTDKGAAKGALVDIETVVEDDNDGQPYSTQIMSLFCRGDGGQGGSGKRELNLAQLPDRVPDLEVSLPTLPQQALLYRLTGDRNPLHADPATARSVGFERPILHGLCTYGIACRAILREFCGYRAERLNSLDVRFAGPLYPGETLVLRMWREGTSALLFDAASAERQAPVLSNGRCELNA